MVIKTVKGMFQLVQNYRDAFQLEAFQDKYIEEFMDRYLYLVGDISSGILRLKGFDDDPKSKNYHGNIQDYLVFSCAFGCPFYILKRVANEQEEMELQGVEVITSGGMDIKPIKKENYDKESLVLKTTPKGHPNIVLDSEKINAMPKSELTEDLANYIKQDKANPDKKKEPTKQAEEIVPTASYVSASPDFDPALKQQNQRFNKNNNKNNNNNNNQNKNNQNNQNANNQANNNNNNQNGNNGNNHRHNHHKNKNKKQG